MADRGLSAALLAELAKRNLRIAHLLHVDFSVPDYLSDTPRDIVWDGNTYLGTGDWINMPVIKESVQPTMDTISLSVSFALERSNPGFLFYFFLQLLDN